MGQIRKIGETYYIEFYARGLLYSQIAGPDLAAAQKLLRETEAKIAGGEALTIERQIDLTVFYEKFLSYAALEFPGKSLGRFKSLIEDFQQFLAQRFPNIDKLSQVTPNVCESYKADLVKRGRPVLVNFSILLLREVMEYGIKIGFINDNPTLHVRLLPWPSHRRDNTERQKSLEELFRKGVTLGKVYKLSKLTDIARLVYYGNSIPLNREDMYN